MRRTAIVATLVMACGGSTRPNDPSACGERPALEGGCVGVSDAPICDGPRCHEGASCSRIFEPTNEPEVQRDVAAARPGECVSLPAGTFGALAVTGGVSILGRRARDVRVASIAIEHATGATSLLRGLTLESLHANGVGTTDLDRVLVEGASGVAVRAIDGSIVLRDSTVRGAAGAGVYVSCSSECPPGKRPRLAIGASWIADVKLIGVWALGVDAELRYVVIERVRAANFQFGRGIEASARATLQGSFVRVTDAEDAAIFVSESAGSLGPGLVAGNSARGVHFAAVPEGGFVLDGFAIERVAVAGIAMTGASRGIALRNGRVAATTMRAVPIDVGGTREVGDGIVWSPGVEATVASSVTIEDSARVAALIDATAKGSFAAKLVGTDATRGIVIEHADGPAKHPALTIADGTKVVYVETFPVGTSPPPAPKP